MPGVWLAASLAAVAAFNHAGPFLRKIPFPPPTEMRLAADDAVTNASLLTLGMRRLAADVMLIRTIVYYGTKEEEMSPEYQKRVGLMKEDGSRLRPERAEAGHEHEHAHDHDSHPEDERFERVGHSTNRGIYPDLGPKAIRLIDMDPFWTYPALYISGALAFNQNRPEEALKILRHARRFLPNEKRYLAYIAAIGFHEKGDMRDVVAELTPLVSEKDSPTMVKNMVAFMNVRLNNKKEAVRLYLEILESRDEKYHSVARKALARLGVSAR